MQGQAVVCAQQRRETSAGSQAVKVSGLGGEITIAGDRFGRRSFCPFVRRLFWAPRLRRPACAPLPATLALHRAQNQSVNVAVLHVTPPHHPCCQPTPSNVSCATTAPQPQPRLSTPAQATSAQSRPLPSASASLSEAHRLGRSSLVQPSSTAPVTSCAGSAGRSRKPPRQQPQAASSITTSKQEASNPKSASNCNRLHVTPMCYKHNVQIADCKFEPYFC